MLHLFNRSLKNHYSPFVVHLTEKFIWILQLQRVDNVYHVSQFRRYIVSNSANYLRLVRKKIKSYNLKKKQVALVIADSCISRLCLKVSKKLNTTELDELVKIEAKNYISNNLTNVCFDYFVLDDKQIEYYKIVIIIANSQLILSKIKFLNSLGLKIKIVDIESNCVLRIFNRLGDFSSTNSEINYFDRNFDGYFAQVEGHRNIKYQKSMSNVLWIDISESIIKIFVIKDGDFFSSYEDSYADSDLLVNEASFTLPELTKYLQKFSGSGRATSFSEIITKIKQIIVEHDLNFVEKIYLSGSYIQLEALRDILSSKNSIPILVFDSLSLLGIVSSKIINPRVCKAAIALGMAL